MLNTVVVRFYDKVGLIFKGSEYMATTVIENLPLSTTPLLIDAASREMPRNIRKNLTLRETRVLGEHFHGWQYGSNFIRFHTVVAEIEAKK